MPEEIADNNTPVPDSTLKDVDDTNSWQLTNFTNEPLDDSRGRTFKASTVQSIYFEDLPKTGQINFARHGETGLGIRTRTFPSYPELNHLEIAGFRGNDLHAAALEIVVSLSNNNPGRTLSPEKGFEDITPFLFGIGVSSETNKSNPYFITPANITPEEGINLLIELLRQTYKREEEGNPFPKALFTFVDFIHQKDFEDYEQYSYPSAANFENPEIYIAGLTLGLKEYLRLGREGLWSADHQNFRGKEPFRISQNGYPIIIDTSGFRLLPGSKHEKLMRHFYEQIWEIFEPKMNIPPVVRESGRAQQDFVDQAINHITMDLLSFQHIQALLDSSRIDTLDQPFSDGDSLKDAYRKRCYKDIHEIVSKKIKGIAHTNTITGDKDPLGSLEEFVKTLESNQVKGILEEYSNKAKSA